MFKTTALISEIHSTSNKIRSEHSYFHDYILGVKKEDYIFNEIKRVIDDFDLKNKSRKPYFTYNRFFIFNYLFDNLKMSYTGIGLLFDRDHSTVIHGIREHNKYVEIKDSIYLSNTLDVRIIFEDKNFNEIINRTKKEGSEMEINQFNKNQIETIEILSSKLDELKSFYSKSNN